MSQATGEFKECVWIILFYREYNAHINIYI